MRRIWQSGVTDGDDDDTFRSIVASAIEIDAVTCYAFYFSFFACRSHIIPCHRVDGGWNDDADAAVRGIGPHPYSRYCSRHRSACCRMRYSEVLPAKVWPGDLDVDKASPHPQRQFAVVLSDGGLRPLVFALNLWVRMTVPRYNVYFEDVLAIPRFP